MSVKETGVLDVYELDDVRFLCPLDLTEGWLWIAGQHVIRSLELDEFPSDLRLAIRLSERDVPHPKDFAGLHAPLVSAAGLPWEDIYKRCTYVSVTLCDDRLLFVPTRRLRGGFDLFEDKGVGVAFNDSDASIAEAYLLAAKMC